MPYVEFAIAYDSYYDKAIVIANKFYDPRFCTQDVSFEGDHIRVSYIDRDGDVENFFDVPATWLDMFDADLSVVIEAEIEKRKHAAELALAEKEKKQRAERVETLIYRRQFMRSGLDKVESELETLQRGDR